VRALTLTACLTAARLSETTAERQRLEHENQQLRVAKVALQEEVDDLRRRVQDSERKEQLEQQRAKEASERAAIEEARKAAESLAAERRVGADGDPYVHDGARVCMHVSRVCDAQSNTRRRNRALGPHSCAFHALVVHGACECMTASICVFVWLSAGGEWRGVHALDRCQ
jgi:hypothetical protein